MRYKDVLALMFGGADDEAIVAALDANPLFADAHIAATLVAPTPDLAFIGDGMASAEIVERALDAAHGEAMKSREALRQRLARTQLAYEVRAEINTLATAAERVAVQARHVDVTVMTRPGPKQSVERDVLETVLMRSGRPVLIVPPAWRGTSFSKVLVAWNASREAARSLGDALPLLKAADAVIVATLDAEPSLRGHGESPGVDIATHLARHDLPVELRNLDSMGDVASAALHQAAAEVGADLIVMGGFGHARLQETLFGGVTRELLLASEIPIAMSH